MTKLIVEMEMPRNCAECPFVTPYSRCVFLGGYAIDENKRADCCPIKGKMPDEHGDLIDRSLLCADLAGVILSHRGLCIAEVIARQPVIIEAERKDDEA